MDKIGACIPIIDDLAVMIKHPLLRPGSNKQLIRERVGGRQACVRAGARQDRAELSAPRESRSHYGVGTIIVNMPPG